MRNHCDNTEEGNIIVIPFSYGKVQDSSASLQRPCLESQNRFYEESGLYWMLSGRRYWLPYEIRTSTDETIGLQNEKK